MDLAAAPVDMMACQPMPELEGFGGNRKLTGKAGFGLPLFAKHVKDLCDKGLKLQCSWSGSRPWLAGLQSIKAVAWSRQLGPMLCWSLCSREHVHVDPPCFLRFAPGAAGVTGETSMRSSLM